MARYPGNRNWNQISGTSLIWWTLPVDFPLLTYWLRTCVIKLAWRVQHVRRQSVDHTRIRMSSSAWSYPRCSQSCEFSSVLWHRWFGESTQHVLKQPFRLLVHTNFLTWSKRPSLEWLRKTRSSNKNWAKTINKLYRAGSKVSYIQSNCTTTLQAVYTSSPICWFINGTDSVNMPLDTGRPRVSCGGSQSLELSAWSCQGRDFTAGLPSPT